MKYVLFIIILLIVIHSWSFVLPPSLIRQVIAAGKVNPPEKEVIYFTKIKKSEFIAMSKKNEEHQAYIYRNKEGRFSLDEVISILEGAGGSMDRQKITAPFFFLSLNQTFLNLIREQSKT